LFAIENEEKAEKLRGGPGILQIEAKIRRGTGKSSTRRATNKALSGNRLPECYHFEKIFLGAGLALSGNTHSFATQSRKRG
jgi:hypothetical protein